MFVDQEKSLRIQYFLLSFCAAFFLLSLMFLFLVTTVHPSSRQDAAQPAALEEEPYLPAEEDALTVLIFGADTSDAVAGTYLLARFDPVVQKVKVAVFPPQTVLISEQREETLSEAYRYGGARYTRDALAKHLNLPIHRYVRISLPNFITAAQAVGSVEFELEEELTLPDGDLSVQLNPGRQLLDGRKVAALIRSRDYPEGELQRCRMTAQLACAIVDQRIDVVNSILLDKIFETIINLVDTDISYADYEERKAAAKLMAESPRPLGTVVEVEGEFSADGERFVLLDTTLAALAQQFL